MARVLYTHADETTLTTIRLEYTRPGDDHIDSVNDWTHRRKVGTLTLLARTEDGKRYPIWIDRVFEERLGALTEETLQILDSTKPKTFRADRNVTTRRTAYYKPTRKELASWTARARQEIKRAKHQRQRQGLAA